MIDLAMLENHWWWLIFAVVLAIGEIVVPGVFLIWVAIGAAITGTITLLLPVPLWAQFLIFAILCLIATWAGRRWYAATDTASEDPLLNHRTARLIGEVVTVVEPIESGRGRVKVEDGVWSCKGPDAPVGAHVRIIGADAAMLHVELA